jgi:hypothetical protein
LFDEYYSLFKKEISLFNRSKAAACLLMLCDQKKNFLHLETEKSSNRVIRNNQPSVPEDARHYPLAEEDSIRLFFGIGRSRRVFPARY